MNAGKIKLVLGYTFGFCLLFILGWLSFHVALGKVEATTSYGLLPLITALATLSGAFANWAFGIHRPEVEENQPEKKTDDDRPEQNS